MIITLKANWLVYLLASTQICAAAASLSMQPGMLACKTRRYGVKEYNSPNAVKATANYIIYVSSCSVRIE